MFQQPGSEFLLCGLSDQRQGGRGAVLPERQPVFGPGLGIFLWTLRRLLLPGGREAQRADDAERRALLRSLRAGDGDVAGDVQVLQGGPGRRPALGSLFILTQHQGGERVLPVRG